jgi:hypothetical protein
MEFEKLIFPVLDFLLFLLPLILPILFIFILWNSWVKYVREKFLASLEYVLLRIIPPRDYYKTPMAMELFINSLYQTGGEATPIDRFWHGKTRPWFSLEIVSHEGEVCFYIWTRKNFSSYIQSQIFAQYPGAEIQEVEDYASKIDYHSGNYEMFGVEYGFTQPDPVPIKTYIDYGLDKTETKPELKIDPLTPTIEFMGSVKQGEHVWIQIIVKAHKKEDKDRVKWFGVTDYWVDDAKKLIDEIKEKSRPKKEGEGYSFSNPTKGENSKIEAIEKSISKLGFDCGIRAVYIAEKDAFNGLNISGLIGSFKQFGSSSLNGFKPVFFTSFDYFWQDISGNRLKKIKKEVYSAYLERGYFGRPNHLGVIRKKMVLNSEELATIFHFPGAEVETPTLTRVQSKKNNAPANLPI